MAQVQRWTCILRSEFGILVLERDFGRSEETDSRHWLIREDRAASGAEEGRWARL
jgi:hypothetical protein